MMSIMTPIHMILTTDSLQYNNKTYYRGYHIRLHHLVIGWHTLECNIGFWAQPHKTATLLYDFTCEVLQSCVIQDKTRCCTPMCVKQ